MSVSSVQTNFMDSVLTQATQTQGRVLIDLLTVQKTAVEASSQPLRPIAGSTARRIDTYA